jgi:hypothetical protein
MKSSEQTLEEPRFLTLDSTTKTREPSAASNRELHTLSTWVQQVLLAQVKLRHSNAELLLLKFHQAHPSVNVLARTQTQLPLPGLLVTLEPPPSLATVFHTRPLVIQLLEPMLLTLDSTCKTKELSAASNREHHTPSTSVHQVLLAPATPKHSNARPLFLKLHQVFPSVDVLPKTKTQLPLPGLLVTLEALPSLVSMLLMKSSEQTLEEPKFLTLDSTTKTREPSAASNREHHTPSTWVQLMLLAPATLKHSNARLLFLKFHQVLPAVLASTKVTTKLLLHGQIQSTPEVP